MRLGDKFEWFCFGVMAGITTVAVCILWQLMITG